MYVRINQTRFDPLREQQARRFIEERVVPAVQQLPGFRRYAGSWSPTGIIGTTRRRSQRGIHTFHRVGSSRLPPAAQRWPYHRSARPPDWRAVGFCRRKIASVQDPALLEADRRLPDVGGPAAGSKSTRWASWRSTSSR